MQTKQNTYKYNDIRKEQLLDNSRSDLHMYTKN